MSKKTMARKEYETPLMMVEKPTALITMIAGSGGGGGGGGGGTGGGGGSAKANFNSMSGNSGAW